MTNVLLFVIIILLIAIYSQIKTLTPLRYKGTMLEDNGFWGNPTTTVKINKKDLKKVTTDGTYWTAGNLPKALKKKPVKRKGKK